MKPLGKVLQQAELISSEHIEIALQEQKQYAGVRLGEILVSHGWLKQETADFFSEQWPAVVQQQSKQPLGMYLKDAGLLDEQQIVTILAEQAYKGLRFGELAIVKGWLKPNTIKFFLEHLVLEAQHQGEESTNGSLEQIERSQPNREPQNHLNASSQVSQSGVDPHSVESESTNLRLFNRSTIKLFKLETKASSPETVLTEVLYWTDGQPILTQKLCRLISESADFIAKGTEAEKVQQLVENHLINNWETQIAAEHLHTISNSILKNQQCKPLSLLQLYQQIWQQGEVEANGSPEQTELLHLRLLAKQNNKLKVANRIYQLVFDDNWIKQELAKLKLFSRSTIKLFKLEERASCPDIVLAEVLSWTEGQPLLTQKVCQLLSDSKAFIPQGAEAEKVQQLVQTRLINNWETQVAAEHLQKIRDSIIKNQQSNPLGLLEFYLQIWQQEEVVTNNSPEQIELLNLGLIVKQHGKLKVANRIYKSVFDTYWIKQESAKLRLFSLNTIKLFNLDSKASSPTDLLSEVLYWTDAQPILTEKLCRLLSEIDTFIPAGAEAAKVQQLVQTHLINNWENQIASEHLQTIRDGIISNQESDALSLLELYQQIWQQGEIVANQSPEQAELLDLGLIVQQQDKLRVANRIYQLVFDRQWIERELEAILHPAMAKTAINNSTSSVTAFSGAKTAIAYPENRGEKKLWALLGIAALMVCGSGLMLIGLNIFKWLEVETIFKRGNDLLHQGEYQQAITKYNKLLKIDSNYYQSWTNRGYALAGMKDYKQMLESCTTATIIQPSAVYAWNCRGEALYNLQQYEQAIAAFDKAIALNPNDPVFWVNKTDSLLALKQPDAAIAAISQAIEMLKKLQEAEGQEAHAKELSVAFSYQAKAFSQKQDHQAALNAYDQALKYNPQYFTALRGKGIALQGLKRDDQAIGQFYLMLERPQLSNSQKAETWYYLGLSLCEFKQPTKAIAAFNEALKLQPNYEAAEQGKKNCR
ncbi:tetratricopeptide repeat protein [Calothrix membranacea FACHB-236]|nr:tetratricopeptide repeat protein [Calothrix membranacea FACHB-236]